MPRFLGSVQEPIKREHAALAVVLRAQHQDRVFDGDDQRDGPDRERHAAEHVGGRAHRAAEEQLIHGIERRGADIAIDDAECAEGQGGKAAAPGMR